MTKVKDLTFGTDYRGDYALFIEDKHFTSEWELDADTKKDYLDTVSPIFFRVIKNGVETSSHGWLDRGEIVQWG